MGDVKDKPSLSSVESGWADGLRGMASLFVVSSHLTLCFARSIVPPSFGQDGPSSLFQRPFLRLIGHGNAAVAIFFVLLGFVNTLKPVQQSRSGHVKGALSSIANSSFRRTGRLVFPAAAVTVISWLLCQLGFFKLARKSNAYWLIATTPAPSPSWYQALKDLIHDVIFTWVNSGNRYDQPQWALQHLFRGSMCIYIFLLTTSSTTPAFRLTAEIILYIWSWISNDSTVLFNVFAGMILAELTFILPTNHRSFSILKESLSYVFAVLGLYLCSYPDQFAEQASWSRRLQRLGLSIFPANSPLGRFWAGLGAQILCFAILTSPSMRRALSTPYLQWLGGLSYSLYLLHGTLIRTIMTWLVFGPMALFSSTRTQTDFSNTPLIAQPSAPVIGIMLVVFFPILLMVAHVWSVKVEPWFGRLTAKFEAFSCRWEPGRQPGRNWDSQKDDGKVLPSWVRKDSARPYLHM